MGLIASLIARVKIEGTDQARGDLSGVRQGFTDAGQAAGKLGQGLSALAGQFVALGAAIASVNALKAGFDTAVQFDSLTRGLAGVETSAASLAKRVAELQKLALSPGLTFETATKGFISLRSAGISADISTRALKSFSNALTLAGKGASELDGVNLALTQIANSESLQGDELNQLRERIPQIGTALKNAFGSGSTEVIRKLGLSTQEVIRRLVVEMEKLPSATGGLQNSLDNFGDTVQQKVLLPLGQIQVTVATAFSPIALKGLLSFGKLLEGVAKNVEGVRKTAVALGTILTGLITFGAIQRVFAMIDALRKLAIAFRSAGIAAAIAEALATGGKSAIPAIAGAAVAGAAAFAAFKFLDSETSKALKGFDPTKMPDDLNFAKEGNPGASLGTTLTSATAAGGDNVRPLQGALAIVAGAAFDAGEKQFEAFRERTQGLMAAIERNTATAADALTLRRQTTGGGAMGRLGVSGAELGMAGFGGNAPTDYGRRLPSSDMERALRRMNQQEIARYAGYRGAR